MKLYHYVHCPFCVRVRLALGFLEIPYESIVVPYNDEQTPIALTNIKMLPIFDFGKKIMNESLDIISELDSKNKLQIQETLNEIDFLNSWTDKIGKDVHSLAMPYWIWTPEFNDKSRLYFQTKKEKKRGPFKELVNEQKKFINSLNITLKNLEEELNPFFNSKDFTLKDIIIASHLWGMYVVPEFQFSDKIHNYLQEIKAICHFNYHQDFWI